MSNLHDQNHRAYMALIQQRFLTALTDPNARLYTTDVTRKGSMFQAYLAGFSEGAERQEHNCNACRSFIERYGSLVTIDAQGRAYSPMWSIDDAPLEYQTAVARMLQTLSTAKVTGVFVGDVATLGTPTLGGWAHFSVTQPQRLVHTGRDKTAGQVRAEKREEFGMVTRAMQEFTPATVAQALILLRSQALYRSEKVLGVAEWFEKVLTVKGKRNLVWRAVALAPAGFTHVRSSMIGTLLDDIQKGMEFSAVSARFAAKMAPSQYQRAQAAPRAGAIEQAEKLIAEMGLAPSLQRRYARLDEVLEGSMGNAWTPLAVATAPKQSMAGPTPVFGHLKARDAAPVPAALQVPAQTMTWDKFRRTVLGDARTLEALVPHSDSRFMALVTAVDPSAPPILQWDNPVSWYYAAGIDAEMRRRVTSAGGQYDNVDIRATLAWDNRNDLDLMMYTPRGDHIYFGRKHDTTGGYLDVDMNIRGETTEPVENIRWAKDTAPDGMYRIVVWNYSHHERPMRSTPFRLEIEAFGKVMQFHGSVDTQTQRQVVVATLTKSGDKVTITPSTGLRAWGTGSSATGVTNAWNLTPGQFVKVNAVVPSPNMWNTRYMSAHGVHTFFLLDGCRDMTEGVGRGFFTETLRSELRPVRSTLEAYNAAATIQGLAEASACGLGMNDAAPWNLTLRVNGSQVYTIDRRD